MAQIAAKKARKSISYTSISLGDQGIGGGSMQLGIRTETDKMLLLHVPDAVEVKGTLTTRLLKENVNKVRIRENLPDAKVLFEVYSDADMKEAQRFLSSAAKQFVDTRRAFYDTAALNLKLLHAPTKNTKKS
jgi:hypothetical protein